MAVLEALIAEHVPSETGPLDAATQPAPPMVPGSKLRTTLKLGQRQGEMVFGARRRFGDTFQFRTLIHERPVTMISHPDHVKGLLTAKPTDAPSVTGESPLRPIVGPSSTLTAVGSRHMRQRKLLLPPFHGEAIAHYSDMIRAAADKELDTWRVGETVEIAPRMQAVTLDVIMSGIFGVDGEPAPGTLEFKLKTAVRRLAELSVSPLGQVGELLNTTSDEPRGLLKLALAPMDKLILELIATRRRADEATDDILSLLMRATTEDGESLTDAELRDELVGLVLAGHETTANQLAWAVERLVRNPAALDALTHAVRHDDDAAAWIDATLYESQRSRPVIPIIGRRVMKPWRFGDVDVPAETLVLVSILLMHHREDLYPDPYSFRPERFLHTKPGTYTWLPFGGGIRRCLGVALAQAEMRIVLEALARRVDLVAVDPTPERFQHRNVTMLPAGNARVSVAGLA